MPNQGQAYKGQTYTQTAESIRYPTPITPVGLPVLTQQIPTDFQLLQEAWNKLSSQMTEMAETNKLSKKAIKNTKKVNSIPNPTPKKVSNTKKLLRK